MSVKSILLFLAIVGGVIWFMGRESSKAPPAKPASLVEGQQKQMQKAANVGKEMQKDLDQRMQSVPAAE